MAELGLLQALLDLRAVAVEVLDPDGRPVEAHNGRQNASSTPAAVEGRLPE
jgi:hypothetical protein